MDSNFEALEEGKAALKRGQLAEAGIYFRQAVVRSFGDPEPWYWMGCLKEQQKDPCAAAYCYYLACDRRRYPPALESLKRLGYLDLH